MLSAVVSAAKGKERRDDQQNPKGEVARVDNTITMTGSDRSRDKTSLNETTRTSMCV